MYDNYNRNINYLRISVTDKCNLRCIYCMPEDGVIRKQHKDFLSFEEITEVVRSGIPLGITKIRLTGGEPLVKRDISDLVRMLKNLKGLDHLAMTTNGILLAESVKELKAAGLDSVNVSLDTLDAERYAYITRGGNIDKVISGLKAARRAELPVKINMVIMDDTTAEDIEELRQFAFGSGYSIQFINHFSIRSRKFSNYSFDRPPACGKCNRIRLLAEGVLKPCLHSNEEIPLDPEHPEVSLRRAIEAKPEHGGACTSRNMFEIGG